MGQNSGNHSDDDAMGWHAHGDDVMPADDLNSETTPPGFDGYDLLDVPLGDLLRGERATLGKSLLDVERELRIRATYIAAIENGDVGAFQSPGFIAGYVRSYARYLGIDPEWTFRRFCEETGFRGIHGGSASQAAEVKRHVADAPRRLDPNEVMASSRISYAPTRDSLFSRVEPGALGSMAVLLILALGIGYGAWAVLNDIQRLQIAPVDDAPVVPLAQLDPLAGANDGVFDVEQGFDIAVPGPETGDRLFRPQALEAPELTPRDQALATLDPNEVGTLGTIDEIARAVPQLGGDAAQPTQVRVTQPVDQVMIFATSPTWVRVTSASGDILLDEVMDRADSFVLPEGEGTPILRTGQAGALYFAVNGVAFGPAGARGAVVGDVAMTADAITGTYGIADTEADPDLVEVASTVFDALIVPDAPLAVPAQPEALVYDPTGASAQGELAQTLPLFPEIDPDQAAAIIASNALPVVVQAPGPDDIRPLQRP